jgi:mRNA interferase MazF
MPNQGDLVLVPVPFTDLSSSKRRPVIIISNDIYHQQSADLVVVAMTSNPTIVPYSFTITSADLVRGALNRPGTVRADRIYTLSQSLVIQTFGKVDNKTLHRIRKLLQELFNKKATK